MKQSELNISTSPESEYVYNEDVQPDDLMFQVGEKAVLKRDTAFEQGAGICCIARGAVVEITSASRMFNHLYKIKFGDATTTIAECDLSKIIPEVKPITDRIKTFEDACQWCNENGKEHLVTQWDIINNSIQYDDTVKDLFAYLKLRIITAALNEGWEPELTEGQWRYYPWFYLYDKNISEKLNTNDYGYGYEPGYDYIDIHESDEYMTDYYTFAFAHSHYSPSDTFPLIGTCLCLKDTMLARYCGCQFLKLWADFCLGQKMKS